MKFFKQSIFFFLSISLFISCSFEPLGPSVDGSYSYDVPPVLIEGGYGSATFHLNFGIPTVSNDNYTNYSIIAEHVHLYYRFDNIDYTLFYGDSNSMNSRKLNNSNYIIEMNVPLKPELSRVSLDYRCKYILNYPTGIATTNMYYNEMKFSVVQINDGSLFKWFFPDASSKYTN